MRTRTLSLSRRGVAVPVAAIAMLVALSSSTVEAKVPTPRVLSPAASALKTGAVVTVRIEAGRGSGRPQVTMYGKGKRLRHISGHFQRGGPNRYIAQLRVGRELRHGPNSIFVATAGGVVERHFTVARPVEGLLRLRRVETRRAERPPLDIRVEARRGILRARLNGVDARPSFERRGSRRWAASLGVKDGLRFGRNRLVVTAFTPSGRFQRQRRSFVVSRSHPLADAGRDHFALTGDAVKLDGRASHPGRMGGMDLSWRLVRKPKGSKAQLRGNHGSRPRLLVDVNGDYRVRLTATGAAAGARASAVAAGASDVVAVTVAPDLPPSGQPVQTLARRGDEVGIAVGSTFYAMAPGAAVQLLALDRGTLEEQQSTSYRAGEEGKLLEAVRALGPESLVILSGGGQGPYQAPKPVLEAIEQIGGLTEGPQSIGVLSELTAGNGGWSAIGIAGIPAGQAYQLIGLQQGAEAPTGAMRGSFQFAPAADTFAFTWAPEYHSIDTQAAAGASENVVSVDGRSWPSWDLPFPGSTQKTGFQLLWFDADTLAPRLSDSSEMDLEVPESEQGKGLWPLRNELRQILADPKPGLLVLNTIGAVETPFFPNKTDGHDGNDLRGDVLARISSLLEEFGANPYVFNTLGATGIGGAGKPGGYSLVGVTGTHQLYGPNAAAELSTRLIAGTAARLTATLQRNRQGVLEPGTTGAPTPGVEATEVQPALPRILAQPAQPFPQWSQLSAEEQAAQEEIAAALELEVDEQSVGIQAAYWGDPGIQWGDKADRAAALCTPTAEAPNPCSAAETALSKQLAVQFENVATVRAYFTDKGTGYLEDVFSEVEADSLYGVTAIANEIRSAFNPPASPATGPNALGIFEGVLGITAGIGEFVPVAGEAVTAAAGVTAGITEIVEASTAESNGEAAFDPYGYHTTLAAMATDLEGSFKQTQKGLRHVADLLVSDSSMLTNSAKLINTSAETYDPTLESRGWALPTTVSEPLEARLRQTLRQFMWLTMMQPVFATYECAYEDVGGVARHNGEAVMNTLVTYPEWRQRRQPQTFNLYNSYVVLADRNGRRGWPQLAHKPVTEVLFSNPIYGKDGSRGLGFLPEYLMAGSLVSGGLSAEKERQVAAEIEEGQQSERQWGALFEQGIEPASSGLMHKDMKMDKLWEEEESLSRRSEWSQYTPSCGHAWNNRWSAQDYSWAEP